MRDDLIFHITTKNIFKKATNNSVFEPESLETEGFIHCSRGDQVEETANEKFGSREQILLLVIDVSALSSELKYDKDEEKGGKYPHIYGPLNTDAIIDRLQVFTENDGTFNIAFSSTT
ncbi:MAG TPA: DUF952 domain-containing protein [Fodinibius sp.]|nr:DUF952 domain-containing protein [Fodinibius sp.]